MLRINILKKWLGECKYECIHAEYHCNFYDAHPCSKIEVENTRACYKRCMQQMVRQTGTTARARKMANKSIT